MSKQRKTERVTGFPGIYRILYFNPATKKWSVPTRGKAFGVKYSYADAGKRRDNRQLFESFKEAKAFWSKTRSTEFEATEASAAESPSGMKFSELLNEFIKYELPAKALSTQFKYQTTTKHFAPLMHMVVNKIVTTDIDKLIAIWRSPEYLSKLNATRCSFDHEFTLLKIIFKFFVDRYDHNYRMPFIRAHSKAIILRKKAFLKKDLTLDQFELFLEKLKAICVGTRFELIYFLAQVQYGIYGRIQEAAALNFEDFDLQKHTVRLDKKVVWLRRKGVADYVERGSKTNAGREIATTSQLEQVWREWALRTGRREGPMFRINANGNGQGDVVPFRMIQHCYDRAFKAAGLPMRGTHVMRHASLSEAYEASRDILAVQALAGHKDLKTTSRYAKTRDKALHEAVEKLSAKIDQYHSERTQMDAK